MTFPKYEKAARAPPIALRRSFSYKTHGFIGLCRGETATWCRILRGDSDTQSATIFAD